MSQLVLEIAEGHNGLPEAEERFQGVERLQSREDCLGGAPSLGSVRHSGSDKRPGKELLTSKQNVAELEIEVLQMKVRRREVAMKAWCRESWS